MSKNNAKPRSKFKKLTRRVGVLLVGFALLVVFAPTFLNWGLGQGILRSIFQQRINGTVTFDQLDLGWIGSQTIHGLRITDADGNEAVNLTVELSAGLLALWSGKIDLLEVDITGTLTGQIRDDGSTTLIDLVAKSDQPDESDTQAPRPQTEAPFELSGIPPTKIRLNDTTVHLNEQHNDSPRTIELNDLHGELAYLPGDSVSLQLQAETKSAGKTGSFSVNGRFAQLFNADGVLTPAGAFGRLQIELRNLILPLAPRETELQSATVSITSENLTETIELAIQIDAIIDGTEAGRLEADLGAHQLITTDGAIDFSLDRVTGCVRGHAVPTTLLQFALQGTPILVDRDLGPTLDIDASFSAGARKEISLTLSSAKLHAELIATVDPANRALAGKRFHVDATIDPALISATSNVSIDHPVAVVVEILDFSLPPIGEDGPLDLGALAANGFIEAKDPFVVTAQDDSFPPTDIDRFRVDFNIGPTLDADGSFTADAQREVSLTLSSPQINAELIAIVDSANRSLTGKRFHVDATIDPALISALSNVRIDRPTAFVVEFDKFSLPPIKESGRYEPGALAATGFIEAKNSFVVTAQDDTFPPTDIDVFRIDLDTARLDKGLHLTALVGPLQLEAEAVRTGDALHVKQAHVALTITPEFASTFLANADTTIVLSEPTTATIDLEPFDLPQKGLYRYELPTEPILATILLEDAILDHVPALVEPISLRDFKAKLTANLDTQDYAVTGDAIVMRAAHDQQLTKLKYDVSANLSDGVFSPTGTLELNAFQIVYLEQMMGAAKGKLSDWVGRKGSVVAKVNSSDAALATTLSVDLPYLDGEFAATLAGDLVSITSDTSTLTLQKSAVESAVNPKPASKKNKDAERIFTVGADVPLALSIAQLRFPLAMLQDKPFDTAAVEIDLTLTGGPLQLVDGTGRKSGLSDLTINVTSNDLAKGVAFALTKARMTGDSAGVGTIDITGKITNLVSEQKLLQLDQRKLNLKAEVSDAPTHVADALLGLDGLLVAAVGPKAGASFAASNFSPDSGAIRGKLTATNGSIEGRIVGRENALILPRKTPLKAELEITPPLAERLLAKIHPVLADIRSTEQPVRMSTEAGLLPLDGDVSRLKANIEITIGNVEFDSGSVTLGLLTLLNASNAKTIPGRIEPIVAKIRKGVVTYDRFEVIIGKYTLAYSGRIDLNTQTVDIRTEIPLDALAVTIKELQGYADKIVVPVVTRGKFGNLKNRIDPDFDMAKAIAEAGLAGLIKEGLGGKNLDLGKLLGEALGDRDK